MTALALACVLAATEPQENAPLHLVTVNFEVLAFTDIELNPEPNAEAIQKLLKSTKPESRKEFLLSTIDQRQARIKVADEVAVITGYTTRAPGKKLPIYSNTIVGSTLSVTPLVQKNKIVIECSAEVSNLVKPPALKEDAEFSPSQKATMTLETTLAVEPGKPIFQYVQDQNSKSNRHYVVVLTAKSKALD